MNVKFERIILYSRDKVEKGGRFLEKGKGKSVRYQKERVKYEKFLFELNYLKKNEYLI